MEHEFKVSFAQLTKLFNIDYSGMWKIKNQISEVKHKETAAITSEEIENYLLKNKESKFLFNFEIQSENHFLNRCFQEETYDIRLDPDEWVEPKVVKSLLDLDPMVLHRIRKQKKIKSKKEILPYRKETSKNSYQYLYEKESVIDFITANYGTDYLQKKYFVFNDEPQFFTVSQALQYFKQENVAMSQASLYRNIYRINVPACRIKDAIRIPILELKLWLAETDRVT